MNDDASPNSAADDPPGSADDHELRAFVLQVGCALSLSGAAVSETQERLTAIAAANRAHHARILVLPTAAAARRDRLMTAAPARRRASDLPAWMLD
jgi:hypothetical protein